jgi:outer membrane PBP1 activator LpoA protein
MIIFKNPKFTTKIIIMLFAIALTSCSVHTTHKKSTVTKKVPPGQAKKMSGQKSAKNYAPGHNK